MVLPTSLKYVIEHPPGEGYAGLGPAVRRINPTHNSVPIRVAFFFHSPSWSRTTILLIGYSATRLAAALLTK